MFPSVSIVIATRNEERNLPDCLESVRWATEVIVVDMRSTDRTREIAQRVGAKVIASEGGPYRVVPYNKNLGLKDARGDWVFFVDADERVSRSLEAEIRSTLPAAVHAAFQVPIITYFFGRWLEHTVDPYSTRIVRRGATTGYSGRSAHDFLAIDGTTGRLTAPLFHFGHPSVETFIEKMNRYTSQDVKAVVETGVGGAMVKPIGRVRWFDLLKDPAVNFYYQFVRNRGYRDGMHGFVVSLLISIYLFVERAKIWESQWKRHHDELNRYRDRELRPRPPR